MAECDYCDGSFDDEEAYLAHLRSEHGDELGRIDRRRVEDAGTLEPEFEGKPLVVYGLALSIGLLVIGATGFVVVDGMGSEGSVHEHGQLTVAVDGETIDFDQPHYLYRELGGTFHFHPGGGNTWHMHPERVDFETAMADIEMPVTETAITIHGETYDDEAPETTVEMTIDDEPASLADELSEGDHVRIVVETDDGNGLPEAATADE